MSRLVNFFYNLDRAIASLFGAPPQETISSESARAALNNDEAAKILCDALNRIQPGHCAHAITHADALDQADDGKEG